MRGRIRSAVVLVSLGIAGVAVAMFAQSSAPPGSPPASSAAAQLRQLAYLKARTPKPDDHFGCGGVLDGHAGYGTAISGDGNTMAVGAPHESSGAQRHQRQPERQFDRLTPAPSTSSSRNGANWTQQAYVKASNPELSDQFGHAVALAPTATRWRCRPSGSRATPPASTATRQTTRSRRPAPSMCSRAAARPGRSRPTSRRPTPARPARRTRFGDGDQFGFSLALSDDGNTLAVGALTEDGSARHQRQPGGQLGAARPARSTSSRAPAATWAQQAYVKPTNPDGGRHVRLHGRAERRRQHAGRRQLSTRMARPRGDQRPARQHAAAAPAPSTSSREAGAAWTQQAYIKPSNTEAGDSFGVHVGLSDDGNTLLAGSLDEDCLATGVNPTRACDNDRAARHLDRRRLRLRAQRRHHVVAAGVPQGVEHDAERLVRLPPGAERRRQHRGDRRALEDSAGAGHQRQPAGRSDATECRRRVSLHARRHDVAPAGLRQGVEHRGVRRVRQRRRAEPRRPHAGGHGARRGQRRARRQRQPGGQLGR